jgi:hypothetical protein
MSGIWLSKVRCCEKSTEYYLTKLQYVTVNSVFLSMSCKVCAWLARHIVECVGLVRAFDCETCLAANLNWIDLDHALAPRS